MKREQVMAKTGGACFYCGGTATTVDHYFPLNPKGKNRKRNPVKRVANVRGLWNLLPACTPCNLKKENLTARDFKKKIGVSRFWGEKRSSGPEGFVIVTGESYVHGNRPVPVRPFLPFGLYAEHYPGRKPAPNVTKVLAVPERFGYPVRRFGFLGQLWSYARRVARSFYW